MESIGRQWPRKKASRGWLLWFLLLFLLDLTVPFTWLSEVQEVTGAFLFWTLWTLVAIASMFAIFLRWRE